MERFAYERTYHLPWSLGATSDDKMIPDVNQFHGLEVVVTEKRDGENTSMYPDGYVHARSIDGTGKEYQSHIIREWRNKIHLLNQNEQNLRFCGENMYARHSLAYDDLDSYFELFGVYQGEVCLAWDTVEFYGSVLDIPVVPVLYRGIWDEKLIRNLCMNLDVSRVEGLVVRNINEFHSSEFKSNVAKFVRANHVTTDAHWTKNWVPNGLKSNES